VTLLFPDGFVWGAATAAHQIEGGNDRSDIWAAEVAHGSPFVEPSGDACDSLRRYPEDVSLVANAGLSAYRFSLDWSRIQPSERDVSREAIAHYRAMVDTCRDAGVQPVVTVHHFASPAWLAREGGWTNPLVVDRFARFCEAVLPVLVDVDLVCTINEPNVMLEFAHLLTQPPLRAMDLRARDHLLAAHAKAVQVLKAGTAGQVGITLALPGVVVEPGGEEAAAAYTREAHDVFLEATRDDDFVGVQTYSDTVIGPQGVIEPGPGEDVTQLGWRFRPEALGRSVRRTYELVQRPIYVTENGLATADDAERITYIRRALTSLHEAMADGVDVRGYFYWSLLDNYEWLHGYRPTFGLVEVDRTTFERHPKPSLAWYGEVARTGGLDPTA
jgi:beta-glucosidase